MPKRKVYNPTGDDAVAYCYDNDVEMQVHEKISKTRWISNWFWFLGEDSNGPFHSKQEAALDCVQKRGWIQRASGYVSRKMKEHNE